MFKNLRLLIASHFSQSLHRLDSPHQEMKYPPIPYDQLAVGQILGSSLSMQWNIHTEILIKIVYLFKCSYIIYIYNYIYSSLYQHNTCCLFMCLLVVIMYMVWFLDTYIHMYTCIYIYKTI